MTVPDFNQAISAIRQGLKEVAGIRNVILFGSVARGTATEDSDLDILVIGEASARDAALELIWEIEKETYTRIAMIFMESLEGTDEQMLDTLFREGVPLVGDLPDFGVRQLALEPWRLVRYNLVRLTPREKVRLSRLLYGYATTKRRGEKVYTSKHQGFLSRVGGRRIGRGAFLIPEGAATEADRILRAAGASRMIVPIWLQKR